MLEDVKDQVVNQMKASPITPMFFFKWMSRQKVRVQLLVFMRYMLYIQETLKEEFLFCEDVQTTTRADVQK